MKERIMHNFWLKILSIFFAAVLWLTVTNVDDPVVTETFDDIPVTIINDDVLLSRGYQYSVESGEKVDVKVKGKKSLVERLSASDFTATADFNSLNRMYMTTIEVECSAERSEELIVSALTENMAIKREDQLTKSFNLDIRPYGDVKEGYYCYGLSAGVTLIQVTGSVSQIEAVKEVVVEVAIGGRQASFADEYEVVAYDINGNAVDVKKISYSQDKVRVMVDICPTKTVGLDVITTGEPDEDYYLAGLEFAPQSVLIGADEAMLRRITNIIVPVDISGADKNVDTKIDLQSYLDELYNGECYSVDSASIGVAAEIRPLEVRKLSLEPEDIEIRNLPEGLGSSVYAMWGLNITIKGPAGTVETVDASDLKLYIDMSGATTGTYSREVLNEYDGDLKLEMSPVMVKIEEMPTAVLSEEEPED